MASVDLFKAVFANFHERLCSDVINSNQVKDLPLMSNVTYPSKQVQAAVLATLCEQSAQRIKILRHRRDHQLLVRQQRIQQLQQKKRSIDHAYVEECERMTDLKYEYDHVSSTTYEQAINRLRTLFFECVAEIEKAAALVSYMDGENQQNRTIKVEERQREYLWQVLLTRIHYETPEVPSPALLIPRYHKTPDKSANANALIEEVSRLIHTHYSFPLQSHEHVEIDTIVSLASFQGKNRPSIRFGTYDSINVFWQDWITNANRWKSSQTRKGSKSSNSDVQYRDLSKCGALFLSAIHIHWLVLPCCIRDEVELFDSNIYFCLDEWKVGGHEQCLDETENSTLAREKQRLQFISSSDQQGKSPYASHVVIVQKNDQEQVFVRATTLQLRQTRASQNTPLPMYVVTRQRATSNLNVLQLNEACISELESMYIKNEQGVPPQSGISAILDRLLSFPKHPEPDDRTGYCVLRNIEQLLPNKIIQEHHATTLFVQYRVVHVNDRVFQTSASTGLLKKREIRRLFKHKCAWRACVDNAIVNSKEERSSVCLSYCPWHNELQRSMDPKEVLHFVPSAQVIKAHCKGNTQSITKVLVQSSSLLQELTSHQLLQSIQAFFQHTHHTITNVAFEKERIGTKEIKTDESVEVNESEQEHQLKLLKEILAMEKWITDEINKANQSEKNIPMVELLMQEMYAWNQAKTTTNIEKLWTQSQQKLSLVQSRLNEVSSNSTQSHDDFHTNANELIHGLRTTRRRRRQPRPQSASSTRKDTKVLKPSRTGFLSARIQPN